MNRISIAREAVGFSQKQVARELKVSAPTVSEWESGKKTPSTANLQRLSELFHVSTDFLLGLDDSVPASTGGVWIPVLGKVAAGVPIEAIEYVEDYEEIPLDMASQGEHFGLRIQGDSMEPKISDSDVVIVRKQDDVQTGEIAVVIVNGDEATVKRIKKTPEGVMLIPSNPAYEPMFYSNAEIETLPLRIIGKVVELRAKF